MRVTKAIKTEQLRRLENVYHDYTTALEYTNPFTLLVATILSAQCTDARVNIITKRIFPRLDSPAKMITLSQQQLEKEIHDCGLYRSKSKHILEMCRILLNNYDGQVPEDFDALVSLPGVGRKTANVVRSVCWGYPGIAVDTHVFRVSNRLKLSIGDTPLEVEEGLQKAIPKENWSSAHHWLIWHGRKICKARKPACEECFLQDVCPSCLVKVSPWENNIK
ncbi:endonuclease III [Dialister pneumosintes]|jgi:endonuclease III|uniref:Endonuclease III n=1 Tax=Dialister pneumosintes TaxID=39950 RepID=A0A1B3WDF3_9FIRM|nr:endonuclease III [Dialister pneumosintes]AOH39004.1 endonuclease III [Dialister pneumosintes]MBS6479838.1 endonuclease III [Dialister sp.]RID94029.1 endonuclease III [Dialister pneumosintes]